ncbi:nibrin-like isoform X2 [Uloborus diversus]|uniref:nibrin-like isoform X2 n=1 Tax=Uloborus diversus TaxID=327109 RepID=UPI00240A6EF3|nr:nibrin-like isoform X2 [Uloborus diversus]
MKPRHRVHCVPLVVTTSCLDVSAKNKIRKIIFKLGGHIVSEWQPCCTHVVMSQVKVTIKALCCLLSCKSIVLPQYFEELEESLSSSATVLSTSRFIPPLGEALIDKDQVSFDVNPLRKNIFNGKTFYFMDEKQFKKLHLGIVLGGGKATILMDDKADPTVLLREGSCFIEPVKDQVVTEKAKILLRDIICALQKKSLRMIPESDIGLAVAYCSTEKFCNPEFSLGAAMLGSQRIYSQTLSEREVYVPDTEEKTSRMADSEVEKPPKRRKVEQESSLNLTSFRDEDDVVEIPLSVQVKQELDDIFEITSDNEDKNITKPTDLTTPLPSTLQLDSEIQMNKTSRTVREQLTSRSSDKSNLKNLNELTVQTKKIIPKVEPVLNANNENPSHNQDYDNFDFPVSSAKKDLPTVVKKSSKKNSSENGFHSVQKTSVMEEDSDLPCNLAQVKFVDLICKKLSASPNIRIRDSSVKNFKKFKKVYPLKAQALPRIIGIHELIPYDRDTVKICNEEWDNPVEETVHQPVKGEFDW